MYTFRLFHSHTSVVLTFGEKSIDGTKTLKSNTSAKEMHSLLSKQTLHEFKKIRINCVSK